MTELTEEFLAQPLPSLTPDLLKGIGQAWGGRHWQSDLARETYVSKSQITRYLKKADDNPRIPDQGFGIALDRAIMNKIADLTKLIGTTSSFNTSRKEFGRAKKHLDLAVALLRQVTPEIERVTIEATSTRTQPAGRKPLLVKKWAVKKGKKS